MALNCDTKTCSACGEEKPASQFSPAPTGPCGLFSYCKPCNSARANAWNKANRERRAGAARRYRKTSPGVSDKARDSRLRRLYGITAEEYDDVLVAQGGVCAICLKPPTEQRRLAVDHSHRTGMVRGLLCTRCNWDLLGKFGDKDPDLFTRAHDYLVDPPAVVVLGPRAAPVRPKKKRRSGNAGVRKGVTRSTHGQARRPAA